MEKILNQVEKKEGKILQVLIPETINSTVENYQKYYKIVKGSLISKSTIVTNMLINGFDQLQKDTDDLRSQI